MPREFLGQRLRGRNMKSRVSSDDAKSFKHPVSSGRLAGRFSEGKPISAFLVGSSEDVTNRSYRLPILTSLAAFLLVLVFFLQARTGNRLPGLWYYWIGLAGTLVPGLVSRSRVAACFSISLFSFLQAFSYVLSAPYGIVFSTDPIYNLQAVTRLAETHFWEPGTGSVQAILYSFYPASIFYATAFGFVTGLPLHVALMLATSSLRFAVLPLATFKLLRRFVGERPSFIAAALVLASPSYLLNLPVLQEFAIVFLVLALYAVYLAPWSSRRPVLSGSAIVAAFLFLTTVALSHYFTAYILAFFLIVLAVSSLLGLLRRGSATGPGSPPSVTVALLGFRYAAPVYGYIFFLWSIYVSSAIDLGWFAYLQSAFQDALAPGSLDRPAGVVGQGVRPGYTYTTLELGLVAAAIVLWLIAASLGFVLINRRSFRGRRAKRPAARVMLVSFLTSLILLFVTVPLVFTSGFFIPLRVFEFAGLGLAPLAGLFGAYLMLKRPVIGRAAVAGAISVLVIGGSLLPLASPRFYYIAPDVQYCQMATHETPDFMAAALWAKERVPRGVRVFGDELTYDIFGGYGEFAPASAAFGGYELFNSTTLNISLARSFGLRAGDIVVVDIYMTRSICFAGFRDTPLPQANLDKFADNALMATLFQNEAITIYRWDGPT